MPSPIQNPRLLLTSTRMPLSLSSKTPCTHRCLASLPSLSPQTLAPQSTTSSILSIRESLLSGRKKAVEIAAEYLDRIRLTEPQLKSFIHLSDSVLKDALELDRKVENGEDVGPLSGVLVGVKDNLCTVDMPSTGGSRILDGYRPAFDATAVRKLREAGAIIVGKTNMDEFGMGSTTEGSGFHVTKNPWDTSRVPGGSSGGSAAAVSARQCVASLGSDTGGSVRQPASFCGVVGLKPTYGRVSRFGLMAYASSLDVVGVFGSSVIDTAIVLSAIAGHDRLDATSSSHEVLDYSSEMVSLDQLDSKPLKGLKIGVIKETLGDGIEAGVVSSIKAASSHLEQLGSIVGEVSLPSFDLGLPAYYILASSEASSNLARYDSVRYGQQADADDLSLLYGDSRAKGLGHEVKMRILMGTYALSAGYYDAYYKRAQQVRTLVQKSFRDALDQYDILISPAAPSAAYKIGEKTNDPLAMYAGDIMTVNVNLAGLPSLVVPCGFVEGGASGLPVGLQMISSSFREDRLLRVGHIFEQSLRGYNFVPPVLSEN